jgi:hypothetical protein
MSRSEGNAKGRSVTLHMVFSLDGFIAKKDNSVSWLHSTGSVYKAGISISEEEAAIRQSDRLLCARFPHV